MNDAVVVKYHFLLIMRTVADLTEVSIEDFHPLYRAEAVECSGHSLGVSGNFHSPCTRA